MGKFNPTSDQVVQEFQADNGLWGSPVFWNNPSAPTLYVWGVNDSLKAFTYNFTTGKFNTPFAADSSVKTLVVYKDTNNDIDQLFGSGTQWAFADLSKLAGAPPSAGDPFAYIFGNQAVVYRGTDGDIHLLHP
jgi:hypothetical protein